MYFLTATLRPETFYGVVNAWVLPEGQYGAFRGINNEIYIMSPKSALNLSYQDRMPVTGQPECLMTVSGQELIGTPLKVRLGTSATFAIVCALRLPLHGKGGHGGGGGGGVVVACGITIHCHPHCLQ